MDISNFRARMQGDGARPNLFEVTINLPAALQGLNAGGAFGNKLQATARATSIPASNLGRVIAPYMGREVYLAGNRTFTEWTVTIINDEDYIVRRTLEQWMAAINTHRSNVRRDELAGSNDYVSDCIVTHLGKTQDSVIATYKMTAAWPMAVDEIPLAWDSNDQLEEFTATFSFDDWVDENETVA